jgi:hypothetical protein
MSADEAGKHREAGPDSSNLTFGVGHRGHGAQTQSSPRPTGEFRAQKTSPTSNTDRLMPLLLKESGPPGPLGEFPG